MMHKQKLREFVPDKLTFCSPSLPEVARGKVSRYLKELKRTS